MMKFDNDMEAYVYETNGIIFSWEEEPEDGYEEKTKIVAEKYQENLEQIIEFMLPDIEEIFGEVSLDEVAVKLGKPVIDIDNGTVTYLEQSFDDMHIFSFEFLDDEFKELQFFSIDG